MSNLNPYDLNNLAGGAIRTLVAPISEPVPANLADVHDLIDPYAANTLWEDMGATTGPFTYGRSLTVSGYTIEQETTAILETPQEVVRTLSAPFAELRPDVLRMIEEGGAVGTTAAVAGESGIHDAIPVGSVSELTQYRVAFVARRLKAQGIVTEPTTLKERGRFLGFVAYRAQLQAENVQMAFGKGQLASATLTFKLFPEPTITDEGEEHGIWFDERAATIAAI